ncbi:MAG: glycosyltransferase family 2 protein [Anaerolineae bacterium]|nr:glycosyltransferase family 2 protein [Anaerolineae bacterium]MCX8067869.1 glycosyltransferase family 2 protein [Anaerolineae bacterium]MDW7990769.1 glycosyltransferase family 2 protein [Anaerolineae bacterium]
MTRSADSNGPFPPQSTEVQGNVLRPTPLVSVIIPNWNGAIHLPTCLESLRRQTWRDFEIIVVDNGSQDDSLSLLARDYPEVRVLALGENRGFAGACNAGIRIARGEFIVLLNNDTEADPHWLEEVVAAFRRHPQAGIVASKMLLFDRRDTFHTAGDYYRVDGRPGNRGVWKTDYGQYDQEEYVFSACGGSAAYRKSMLDEVGWLDEDFFYSCEDVDLAWRAQLAGWRCVYAPRAVVYHKLSATGGGPVASFYDGRNFIYLLVKDYPGDLWRRYWYLILRAQFQLAWEALRAWRGAAARARLRGMLAGLLGIPRMLRKRRAVQRSRRVDRAYLESILTGVDEMP